MGPGDCPDQHTLSPSKDTPSWWPWIEVFRELKGELDPHTWKRALESASDALLRLLQEVKSVAPHPMATNFSNDAFLLVDDMVRLLCRISLSRPLVVVLDDLHRMDPSSLRLVEYALHLNEPAQLLIIGTFRAHEATGAAIHAVLAAAAKTASSITFELAPATPAGRVGPAFVGPEYADWVELPEGVRRRR